LRGQRAAFVVHAALCFMMMMDGEMGGMIFRWVEVDEVGWVK
jgi:hypothetical protein